VLGKISCQHIVSIIPNQSRDVPLPLVYLLLTVVIHLTHKLCLLHTFGRWWPHVNTVDKCGTDGEVRVKGLGDGGVSDELLGEGELFPEGRAFNGSGFVVRDHELGEVVDY